MKNILTEEDNKKLRILSKILRSQGMREGLFEKELESYYTPEKLDLRPGISFSNNYTVEIPEFIFPVFEKIWSSIVDKIHSPDAEIYNNFEIVVDAKDQTVEAYQNYSYTTEGDTRGNDWVVDDGENIDEDLQQVFVELENVSPSNQQELQLDYEGSGDSGFIENHFTHENIAVPRIVEDWCYSALEDLHGGWEINEGSKGYFLFNLKNKEVSLEHTYNENTDERIDLFSHNFGM